LVSDVFQIKNWANIPHKRRENKILGLLDPKIGPFGLGPIVNPIRLGLEVLFSRKPESPRPYHRNLRSYARRNMFEKQEKNFQLISILYFVKCREVL
jgi:hypothetical protein